jgi:nucleoside-diphosphate-sugar epimerase
MLGSKKTVIVSGATGFIGGHIVEQLQKMSYKVIAPVRNIDLAKQKPFLKNVELVHIYHLQEIEKISQGDCFIHCAWGEIDDVYSSNHLKVYLPEHYSLLKRLIQEEKYKKIIVLGSCFEYGKQYGPMKASAETKPNTPYAKAKDQLHRELRALNKVGDVELIWARIFYTYGPRQPSKTIIAQFDKALECKKDVFNMSFGEQLLDYLPVEKVAENIVNLLTAKNGVYNICSGAPKSVRRILEERMISKNQFIKLNLGHFPYRADDSLAIWGDEIV